MSRETRSYTARWVFPVSGPPLERGTIVVCGDRIEAVEPPGHRTPDADLGNVAIIPGLVNAHTHLDLSGARGLIPPTDPDHFTDWLKGVIAYRRTRTPEQTQADIRAGLAECLRFGTTLVGDIASEGASWTVLNEAKMRAVVYYELIGLSEERADAAVERARGFITKESLDGRETAASVSPAPPSHGHPKDVHFTRLGFSPHAPYSAHWRLFGTIGPGYAIATHLAESPGEMELLASHTGSFVDFLSQLGVWNPEGLGRLGSILTRSRLNEMNLLVHCNYLPQSEWKYIDGGGHVIAYCPRTHAAFGHPPHPFREFLARGVRVCLGTDSLASNPDLDILAEARFVRSRYPDFPGDQLLRMVTLSGAEALGWADECGSLEPGKSADFVVIPLPDEDASDPHALLLDHPDAGNRRTMWRGEWRD